MRGSSTSRMGIGAGRGGEHLFKPVENLGGE